MDKQTEGLGIKIHEIKEISFANKVDDDLIEKFYEDKVEIKLGYAVRGDIEKSAITIGIIVHFYSTESDKPKEFLKLETTTTFYLQKFTDDDIKFIDGNKEIFINDNLMQVFLSTAIGATRGMLAYKMASLPINICLPLFNMDNLIPKNKSTKKVKNKEEK